MSENGVAFCVTRCLSTRSYFTPLSYALKRLTGVMASNICVTLLHMGTKIWFNYHGK